MQLRRVASPLLVSRLAALKHHLVISVETSAHQEDPCRIMLASPDEKIVQ